MAVVKHRLDGSLGGGVRYKLMVQNAGQLDKCFIYLSDCLEELWTLHLQETAENQLSSCLVNIPT